MNQKPHFDFYIDIEKQIDKPIKYTLKNIVKDYAHKNDDEIELKKLDGGVTNMLYRVSVTERDEKNHFLIRIFGHGSEQIIDRKKEMRQWDVLHSQGFCPQIYGTFTNGMIYGFISGRPLSPEDVLEMHNGKYSELIAKEMARWHKDAKVPEEKTPLMWKTIDQWMEQIPSSYNNPDKDKKLKDVDLDLLREELKELRVKLDELNSPILFCHNDLLPANIIYNEEKNLVRFIDYEYGGYNFRGFDLGNHFNEYAGLDLDYSKYPNEDQQKVFLRNYFKNMYNREPTDNEFFKLVVEANRFSLASHFFWGIWSFIQAKISKIDFDYMQYGIERIARFRKTKDVFYNLK